MKWIAVLLLAVGCAKPTPGLMESCQTSADCSQGLVCLGNKCGECRQDSECPGVAKCGLVQAGRCGCYDADGDGASCDDCDDADPARFPGAAEVCDMRDNDCDGTIDEGTVTTWFVDADGDGYGNGGLSLMRCQAPANFVARGGDCNDSDPTTFPGRTEVCDGRDNNCDGTIDEGVKSVFYRDADGDGFGDFRNTANVCQIPAAGFVAIADDCDDSRADANPQAMETCNNRDDDCDGVVDGLTRSCSNTCGSGQETCTRGVWGGCTAPPIVTLTSNMTLTGPASFDCLLVAGSTRLTVAPDTTLTVRNWLRFENLSTFDVGPRGAVVTGGDLTFADRSVMLATDATLVSGGKVEVAQEARWYAQAPQAAPYSSGGSAACASQTMAQPVGGAGGGARGGTGGQGSTCNTLTTQPRTGAGGRSAQDGTNGCGCNCMTPASGGFPSGGSGGTGLAGGGGGANGGAGGLGGGARASTTLMDGGSGGTPEGDGGIPDVGGGAGGSSGTGLGTVMYTWDACQGTGGHGGGIIRLSCRQLLNLGVLSADGTAGDAPTGGSALAGGGGGGAGGTWVFRTALFENRGAVSAVGGRGGAGASAGYLSLYAGGGGGGSGGRIHLEGADGGSPTVVRLGGLFVGGGVGGMGLGGNGADGEAGAVITR